MEDWSRRIRRVRHNLKYSRAECRRFYFISEIITQFQASDCHCCYEMTSTSSTIRGTLDDDKNMANTSGDGGGYCPLNLSVYAIRECPIVGWAFEEKEEKTMTMVISKDQKRHGWSFSSIAPCPFRSNRFPSSSKSLS